MPDSDLSQFNKTFMEKLRGIPCLQSFTDEDLQGLLDLSIVMSFEPGETIIDENSSGSLMYFLITGSVRITKHDKELRFLRRRGEIFGEMSAIAGSARSASAYAVDETVCLATDISSLTRLPENSSLIFYFLLYKTFSEVLAERLRDTTKELVNTTEELIKAHEELDVLRG